MGASLWASGSHVCSGTIGSFTANPMNRNRNTQRSGSTASVIGSPLPSTCMSKVPALTASARMATSMKAEPATVYSTNFIAEYSRRPEPQIEMSRYIGNSSSSQNRKKSRKSIAVNTPRTAVESTIRLAKYARGRCSMLNEMSTEAVVRNVVSTTSGMLSPSTARKYWMSKKPTSIQGSRATYWNPPPVSKLKNMTSEMASATSEPSSATQRDCCARPEGSSRISSPAKAGRNTSTLSSIPPSYSGFAMNTMMATMKTPAAIPTP